MKGSDLNANAPDGATPLDPDEADGLKPGHVQTQRELNAWEALNIDEAARWLARRRSFDPLNVERLTDLHRRMFDHTWKWAGALRRSDKNVSPYHWTQVPRLLHDLADNTRAQREHCDGMPSALDDIAMRFHHGLVHIHPFPNGNGRHARLATDALLGRWKRPPFTWGSADLTRVGDARARYLAALKAADAGDFAQLRDFVRS